MLFLPVLNAELPLLRTPRFHSPRTDFQMGFVSTPLIAIPTIAAPFKVSDVFEISRARQR
jgi:hypothetical protein